MGGSACGRHRQGVAVLIRVVGEHTCGRYRQRRVEGGRIAVVVRDRRMIAGYGQVKSQSVQLFEVGGGGLLRGAAAIKFFERIAGPLYAAIEKTAGIGGAAVVSPLGVAAIQ